MAGVLQHLRSSTLDKRPNPASMVDGQVAINYASGSPGMFFKDSNGDLVKVGPVHVGATAPNVSPASGGTAGNSTGEQWLDTSGGTYVFKIWDGAAWRSEAGEFVNTTGDTMTGSLTMGQSADIIFEGSVDDGFETTLTVANPTADRTITLPNVTGTVVTTGDSGSVTSTMIADGTIVNADVNASAAIAGTKISPDFGSQNVVTTGTSTAASFIPTSSTVPTNGVYLPSANNVAISTNGTERARIDSSGRLLVGTSSARANYFNGTTAANSAALQLEGNDGSTRILSVCNNSSANVGPIIVLGKSNSSTIPSYGLVSQISGADTNLGRISWQGADGTELVEAASITALVDGTPGANDMPGRLVFSTTANGASSPTERMRIDNIGAVSINTTSVFGSAILSVSSGGSGHVASFRTAPTSGTFATVIFYDGDNTDCGSIDINTTANTTAYTTSSDYRLKTKIKPLDSSIQRLAQLKPCTWEWLSAPGVTGEGFIAHEAQEVVPEAVTGTKDEVNDDGKPVYQGIDQSKLVPLLTAALQEAIGRIETLEAEVAALKAQ